MTIVRASQYPDWNREGRLNPETGLNSFDAHAAGITNQESETKFHPNTIDTNKGPILLGLES
jgi:hypothetical protein